ncbi:MAG: hypothetical protein PHR96_03480 [Clostridia bacterium]|nr:hypothetical protein [Clostridia bacterium]
MELNGQTNNQMDKATSRTDKPNGVIRISQQTNGQIDKSKGRCLAGLLLIENNDNIKHKS